MKLNRFQNIVDYRRTTKLVLPELLDLCGPGMIRTCDTWFRKPLLYPLSYGANRKSLSTKDF